ncbi:unnamed protein product [Sphacelaria rigidula]
MEHGLAMNENPLKWWALNAHKHLLLIAHVARNALTVPASSGPSERVFFARVGLL